jgi:hypothetical protein
LPAANYDATPASPGQAPGDTRQVAELRLIDSQDEYPRLRITTHSAVIKLSDPFAPHPSSRAPSADSARLMINAGVLVAARRSADFVA